MPVIPKPVGKWKYRRVQFGEVPSDVRAEWCSHGPSHSEIRAEFEPKVQDMMLDIALELRGRWRYSLCSLAAKLAPDERSKLYFRVALARHWEGGRIFIGVRYRDDLPPASEMDEEPSGEDGYVMTKHLVVSPVTAKLDEWIRGEEPVDPNVDAISQALSGQPLKLYEFLRAQKSWTRFAILGDLDCWRDRPSDETIYRGLRRLRQALNEIEKAPHLHIEKKPGRTKLDKTEPK